MISVRLDEDAARALALLEASGLSRSDAVRVALKAAAAGLRHRPTLAAEVAALGADDADVEEAQRVREMMEDLRAPW